MRDHPAMRRPLLILALAGCSSGGGGNRPDAPPPPPPGSACTPLPLVDTSSPDRVVGTGTADSCTEAELRSALAAGGVITFNCGASPVTIPITSELRIDGWEGP